MKLRRARPPLEQVAELDMIIHEPARLTLLTALSACESAQFRYLQAVTGLTQGNLSVHLARLEEHGFIEIEKFFAGKYPRTSAKITDKGRKAIAAHWKQLARLKKAAENIPPEDER